ncbi:MAG: BACON domain-containing carbohydrate-binding protein [Bryobacteraceae bacterium]
MKACSPIARLVIFHFFLALTLFQVRAAAQAAFSINTVFPPAGGLGNNSLTSPNGLAVDGAGGLYIVDTLSNRIFHRTSGGTLTVVAGTGFAGFSGDAGPATGAQLNQPSGLARDSAGNLYVADSGSNRIRKITTGGVISTVAGNGSISDIFAEGDPADQVGIGFYPQSVAVDSGGNLYLPSAGRSAILKVNTSGAISTYVSAAPGGATLSPAAVAIDVDGSLLIGTVNGIVRKPVGGAVVSVSNFTLSGSYSISADAARGVCYHTLSMVKCVSSGGQTTDVASAGFVTFILFDGAGNLLFSDPSTARVVKLAPGGAVSTVYQGMTSPEVKLPKRVAVGPDGSLYISDESGHAVWRLAPDGTASVFAGTGNAGFGADSIPATQSQLLAPGGVAVDSDGKVYIAEIGAHRVRMVSTDGVIHTVAGTQTAGYSGDGSSAAFATLNSPMDVAVDAQGNLFIADTYNNRIRRVAKVGGVITTVAGSGPMAGFDSGLAAGDGADAVAAQLNNPTAVAIGPYGDVFVADSRRVRRFQVGGTISTIAGNGRCGDQGDGGPATGLSICVVYGLTLDPANNLYVSTGVFVRRIDPSGGTTIVAGAGASGSTADGDLAVASKIFAWGIAVDASGNLYLAESNDKQVRKVIGGTRCAVALSDFARAIGSGADTGSLLATPGSSCAYSASSDTSWLHIDSGSTGGGATTLSYAVDASLGSSFRSGAIRITVPGAYASFYVFQAGAACQLSLSATAFSTDASANSTYVLLTQTPSNCAAYTTAIDQPWLTTFTPPVSGGGPSAGVNIANNPTSQSRTGTLTISGQTFTVMQSASPVNIISPAPGSALSGATSVQWSTGPADMFRYEIATSPGLADLGSGFTTSGSASLSNLPQAGATVYFRLWHRIAGLWRPAPLDVSYIVAAGNQPGPVALQSPADGATGIAVNTSVTWSAATGATSYDVYFGTTNPPPLFTSGSGLTSNPTLIAGTTYFWKITARNAGGSSVSSVWSFTTAGTAPPAPNGVSPASGNTLSQKLTFTFTDPRGWQDLGVVNILINNALDGRQACYLAYGRSINALYLINDTGDDLLPALVLNGAGSVSNSQCTINGSQSSFTGTGNTLTLALDITFAAGFAGNKITYLAARDVAENNSGWQALGTWQVPGSGPAITTSLSGLSPRRGAGLTQTFTFTINDTAGWQDLGVVNVLINDAIDGRQACYMAYVRSINVLYLVDDAGGTLLPPFVLNNTSSVQNNQCVISGVGSSVTGSGNAMTLTLKVTFKNSFVGNRLIYGAARDVNDANNTGWQPLGTWTVQ